MGNLPNSDGMPTFVDFFMNSQNEFAEFGIKDLITLNPNNNTSLHVFDHTIKPISLYGCEIWGSFNPTTARFRNEAITLDKIYQNLKCELLLHNVCILKNWKG
jgi:hypothetical protein